MLIIRCKNCEKQLEEHPSQLRSCQCTNLTSIRGGHISGVDLSLVEIVSGTNQFSQETILTKKDLEYQEARRKRKVTKLDFEIR